MSDAKIRWCETMVALRFLSEVLHIEKSHHFRSRASYIMFSQNPSLLCGWLCPAMHPTWSVHLCSSGPVRWHFAAVCQALDVISRRSFCIHAKLQWVWSIWELPVEEHAGPCTMRPGMFLQCLVGSRNICWFLVHLEKSVVWRLVVLSIVGELLCDVRSALLPSFWSFSRRDRCCTCSWARDMRCHIWCSKGSTSDKWGSSCMTACTLRTQIDVRCLPLRSPHICCGDVPFAAPP